MERIVPANLDGDELWRRNGEYVDAKSYDTAISRIAELEAALKLIASGMQGDRFLADWELSDIANKALTLKQDE